MTEYHIDLLFIILISFAFGFAFASAGPYWLWQSASDCEPIDGDFIEIRPGQTIYVGVE